MGDLNWHPDGPLMQKYGQRIYIYDSASHLNPSGKCLNMLFGSNQEDSVTWVASNQEFITTVQLFQNAIRGSLPIVL